MTRTERLTKRFLKRVYSQCMNACVHKNESRFRDDLKERISNLKQKNTFSCNEKEPYTFINVANVIR